MTTLQVELSPSTWQQVGWAVDERLSALYRQYALSVTRGDTDTAATQLMVINQLTAASAAINSEVYRDVLEPPDGLDEAKRERAIAEAVS